MKAKEIRDRSDDELRKGLGDLEEQLFKLRFQMSAALEVTRPTLVVLREALTSVLITRPPRSDVRP